MSRFRITMTKTGHAAVAYLHKWEQEADGITYGFSPNLDRAMTFDGGDAVSIVTALRSKRVEGEVKYSTVPV